MDKDALRRAAYNYAAETAEDTQALFARAGQSRWFTIARFTKDAVGKAGAVTSLGTDVRLRIGVTAEGEYACTGLVIGLNDDRAAIPARTLRVPLQSIVEELVEVLHAVSETTGRAARRDPLIRDWMSAASAFFDPRQAATPVGRLRRGRRLLDDDHYRTIARQYQEAERDAEYRRRPMIRLAEQWPTRTPRTLKHWVAVARKKGYLRKWQPPKKRSTGRATQARTRRRTA